jgi:tRNA-Thr(GGU) m(6)t(6)A37 methyltransferase TsaA
LPAKASSKENAESENAGSGAECVFIGSIRTPYMRTEDCPRNVREGGEICTLEVKEEFAAGLLDLEKHDYVQVLYWLHATRRDLLQLPRGEGGRDIGVFALRSPTRPNPIGSSVVKLIEVRGSKVRVQGLDCLDGTPLLDIKRATGANAGRGEKRG